MADCSAVAVSSWEVATTFSAPSEVFITKSLTLSSITFREFAIIPISFFLFIYFNVSSFSLNLKSKFDCFFIVLVKATIGFVIDAPKL